MRERTKLILGGFWMSALVIVSLVLFMFLFTKWSETSDMLYLIMGCLALMLCVGVTTRRSLVMW